MKSGESAIALHPGRQAILQAARSEFAKAGFHGAKMREIAQRAGVSQGLLHHHFQGKEGLWNAVGEQASAEFLAYVSGVVAQDTLDSQSIPTAIRTYLQYWRDHPDAFRINLWRLLDGPTDERKSRSRSLNERVVPLIKQAQQSGFLRTDMPTGVVLCIAGALVQFWLHNRIEMQDAIEIGGEEMPDDETFIHHIMQLIQRPTSDASVVKGPKTD
ncbi:TetR/AcrR family transcriptional regulator [Bradyrhizobium sp. LHD-71]|uniref:TetR/AcrR family transcriptional regulator n=1 Tax=Bradyrhizobium sp. LHD-71 TaxID=3072141 RepID=UPI00280DA670|nr:TetR/AcrR family transcriptional regulator [Bradyrhizobium sp. LHD-71]MDQ8732307.1 TetR/AcrR family transcriptional regulator [Bradyrhizobium sp. LHD-71]